MTRTTLVLWRKFCKRSHFSLFWQRPCSQNDMQRVKTDSGMRCQWSLLSKRSHVDLIRLRFLSFIWVRTRLRWKHHCLKLMRSEYPPLTGRPKFSIERFQGVLLECGCKFTDEPLFQQRKLGGVSCAVRFLHGWLRCVRVGNPWPQRMPALDTFSHIRS